MRIQEIVTVSHIPRSSLYEVLRSLIALGIVEEVVHDTFKYFKALSISSLRHSLQEAVAKLDQQLTTINELERELTRLVAPPSVPTAIRYHKGKAGARQIYWNTLKANETVYVYSEWGRQKYVGHTFYENFADANRKRHTTEKVLINLSSEILQAIKQHTIPKEYGTRTRVEDIRVLDSKTARIVGDTMIYNNIYAQVYLRNANIHGFEIESEEFVSTQRSIFETLWRVAKPVADFL